MKVITGGHLISSLILMLRIIRSNQSVLCVNLCAQMISWLDLEMVKSLCSYSPVGVNATLQCVVNNTILMWVVDGLTIDSPIQRPALHSREIFQGRPTTSVDIWYSSI